MTTPMLTQIAEAHRVYCQQTQRNLPYNAFRHEVRWAHVAIAIRDQDVPLPDAVRLVATRVLRLSKDFQPWLQKLNYTKFTNEQWFSETLADELAEQRNKVKVDPAARYQRMDWRKPKAQQEPEGVRADIAFQRTKLAEQLRQWRENQP